MTANTGPQFGHQKMPLGVGGIIGDSFSILFRKFLTVVMVSFVPMAVGLLASGFLVGWGVAFTGEFDENEGSVAAVKTSSRRWRAGDCSGPSTPCP